MTSQLQELLTEDLQELLDAENQLVAALPEMANAAKSSRLRMAFEKHLEQTKMHVERLKHALQTMTAKAAPKACRAMDALIQEGRAKIEHNRERHEIPADLALITSAQKVEHFEIAAYGNARTLAHELDHWEIARLLGHTLGEEESADHLLTEVTKPMLQQARMEELSAA